MLARRVIALSPDKAFSKQLGTALRAAGGAVEVHAGLDALGRGEIQAALIVVHLDGELAGAIEQLAPRLTGDGKIVAILPRSDLARTIASLQQSDKVASVLVGDAWRASDLSAVATRILAGDIFGLEKIVPWGTKIYSQLVGDYQEKSLCIAQISEFAELMGVRRKYREAIEQVVDEMLMNALYDAPVDDQGKQIFAEIPTKTRISLRMEQKVVVQYACDDRTFSVSVRDSFGTLNRETVIRYVDKCLHSAEQIDRKTGGAGLGLYLMANSSTRMFFNVLPGVATEAVCAFDLDTPKIQLQTLGFFQERIDAAGRLAAGPSRLLPAGVSHPVERRQLGAPRARTPAGMIAALSAAIMLSLVMIALVAYPRFFDKPATGSIEVITTPGAVVEVPGEARITADAGRVVIAELDVGRLYTVSAELAGHRPLQRQVQPGAATPARIDLTLVADLATVTIDSDPPGATVSVDGIGELGVTPLTTDRLAPRTEVTAVLRKGGYKDEQVPLRIPGPGGELAVVRELDISADIATIVVTSDPPGARVLVDDQLRAGSTPTDDIQVEAGQRHVVKVQLEGYATAVVPITPARGARSVPVHATLNRGVSIHVRANLEGRVSIARVPDCDKRTLPASCAAQPGTYEVKVETTKVSGKLTRTVKLGAKDVVIDLELGIIEAPDDAKLLINRREVDRAAVEAGRHRVTVKLADGTLLKADVKVAAGTKPTKVNID
jgi:hypothetical protein